MKLIALLFLLASPFAAAAQQKALATSDGAVYTAASLSPAAQRLYENQDKLIAEMRARLFDEMIAAALLEIEAQSANSTPAKLLNAERAKAPPPTEAQIKTYFESWAADNPGVPLDTVHAQIRDHLRHLNEEKVLAAYVSSLKTKHKATIIHEINAPGLKPFDAIAKIGERKISVQEFENYAEREINDARAEIFEELLADLSASVLSALLTAEAAAKNTDSSSIIAAEITDKMREFSEAERGKLESDLRKRLFAKYKVKLLLEEPVFTVHQISTDTAEPAIGPASAPVTVIMFTDFQCPACAATHPVLKQVISEYEGKVRLVLRDFPLESIHRNAFDAALAANAANAQGKFIQFAEKLYSNQDRLDKASLADYARELGLNVKQFELDFSDAKAAEEIRSDISEGIKLGLAGTPSIFVNGVKATRLSADSFRYAIERALK